MDWRVFRECGQCGHANVLPGCECTMPRCICFKKNRDQWNGLQQVNGGLGYSEGR